ncbi:hypothetical protein J1N35_044251, partial [Gossypium stocksii]
MVIFFKQLEVDYIFFSPSITEKTEDFATILKDSDVNATIKAKHDKDKKNDKSAKSSWDTLEKKYGANEFGIK